MSDPDRPRDPGRRAGHTGRRPGSIDTRALILEAARAAFGERGFDGGTVRDIAARAGVDPALVHHFYGTKQRLFMAAMQFPIDFPAVVRHAVDCPPEQVGEQVVRAVLTAWEDPATAPLIIGLMRSATTDPVAAEMLRNFLSEGPLMEIAELIDRPDARLRAVLVGSHLIGLAMARYVVRIEPLASADIETVIRAVAPTVQRYLMGELELAP